MDRWARLDVHAIVQCVAVSMIVIYFVVDAALILINWINNGSAGANLNGVVRYNVICVMSALRRIRVNREELIQRNINFFLSNCINNKLHLRCMKAVRTTRSRDINQICTTMNVYGNFLTFLMLDQSIYFLT